MITTLILIVAIGVLIWGFYRARPFGKPGILAWLQSVALMTPWLLFFGLFAIGIYLNLATILFLFVACVGLYIFLGRQLRSMDHSSLRSRRFSSATNNSETPHPEPGPSHAAMATEEKSNSSSAEDNLSQQSDRPSPPTSEQPADSAAKPMPAQTATRTAEPSVIPIPEEDMKAIQSIFGVDTFFRTETIPYQNGAIFKGNLRGEVETTHSRLTAALTEQVGDRYRLFLLAGPDEKPVVVVLPSSNDPQPLTPGQKGIAALLAIATLATCLEASSLLLNFDLTSNLERILEVLPFALGIVLILSIHELAHHWQARRHQVRLSLPFFIPTWQLGSFGALNRFESLLPNRSVLFDIAFAGPAAGGLVSLSLLLVGMVLSHPGSFFQLPSEFFQGSILVGTLARVILGDSLQQPLVDVHPLMVLGWLGLVLNAINLLPAGQLDGGRIMQAIYGRKIAGRTTIATLILLGLAALVNPLALYWAIVILFLQRDLERPALNELTDPDDARAALGLLVLFLMVATLLPLTPGLAGRLGIGG
jgi:membrane-associated protease RseP (regulator of RpoE activity)